MDKHEAKRLSKQMTVTTQTQKPEVLQELDHPLHLSEQIVLYSSYM